MNDKFAKDTHNALQHRPVYQKRNRQLPSPDGKRKRNPTVLQIKEKSKEGKLSKLSKGKDKTEFAVGTSVIDDEIMNTPEVEKDTVNDDLETTNMSDCKETSNNNGDEDMHTECATEEEKKYRVEN